MRRTETSETWCDPVTGLRTGSVNAVGQDAADRWATAWSRPRARGRICMSPNVVVVDDNPAVVGLMTQVLERAGHDVVGCLELSAAEAVIADRLPDAVLLELRRRNEYAGWSLLCRLRQRHDTCLIPVLV